MQVAPGIIILDGTDVAGKTTLAKALIDKYGGHYLHATYRFKDRMSLYHLALLRQAIAKLKEGKTVIMDRWWPSEMIYGDVYRNGRRVPNEEFRILHRLALRYGAIYVICYRDSREKLMEEFTKAKRERDEQFEADDRVMLVHDKFKDLYQSIKGQQSRWLRYNVDTAINNQHYFTATLDVIGHCSTNYNLQRLVLDQSVDHSVGSPFADYLFVGERIRKAARALDYPWISFAGASINMAKSLGELGVPEHRILWSNAYLPDGQPNQPLATLLSRDAPFRKVVAMGQVATDFCKANGKCTFSMPHPAYLTRFNGADSLTRVLGQIFT